MYSEITPEEFEWFSNFIRNKKNTNTVYQLMKPEWDKFMETDFELNTEKSYLFQKISQQILQDEANSIKKKIKIYSIVLQELMILVLWLLFSSIWFYIQSRSIKGVEEVQTVINSHGAKTQLIMPDGSTVWLNSGSTLTYSINFSKKRQVDLKGEGFFKIQKGAIPFVVHTNYGKIRVLGTVLNVLVTTLVRDSLQIDSKENKHKLILDIGEQAKLVGNELV